jgi:hypothetical protein
MSLVPSSIAGKITTPAGESTVQDTPFPKSAHGGSLSFLPHTTFAFLKNFSAAIFPKFFVFGFLKNQKILFTSRSKGSA